MKEQHLHPYADDGDVRPNIIWFVVDQMRAQAMSLVGDPNVHTPNLDRMARDGAHFPNAVMGFPLCCPARGSMMTGQYPHRCVPGHEYPLPTEMTTIADPFNEAGYHTAWLGKWHLDGFHEGRHRGCWAEVPRQRRGRFKTWIGYDNNNSQFDCWVHGHDQDREVPLYRLPKHESESLTDLLIDQIDKHADESFFLSCNVQPPHDPYSAPAEWARRHNPATLQLRPNVPRGGRLEQQALVELAGYYALIEHVDEQVGRVMRHLEERGLADRTYLIFTSDHGDQHGSHGYTRKMTPLEEAIRVPFMVWGGHRWHYRMGGCEGCINHVDLPVTSLGLAGIPVPDGMQGFDYSPAIIRRPWSPQAKVFRETMPDSAYLQLVIPTLHPPANDIVWRGLVTTDGWKYVAMPGQPMYLFDLNEDPYELCNLAWHAQAAGKRQELNERLRRWINDTGDDFPLPEFGERGHPVYTNSMRERYAGQWRQPD
ncbi:MAG: sulfatase [Planctomycetota bacterium]